MIMIGDMLGVAPRGPRQLLRWSDDMIKGSAASAPLELQMGAVAGVRGVRRVQQAVVADRRAKRGPRTI